VYDGSARLAGQILAREYFDYPTARRPIRRGSNEGDVQMEIYPNGSRPSRRGPADSFTGVVWQEPIIEAPAPALLRSAYVRFEPGARTAWHTHPLGQTLCVVSGIGRVQTWGGKVKEIRPGDVVWIPPNEKHWHGAGPTTNMVHIASQEALDGNHVTWMEHVTDEQYNAPVGA
jgi:quercetin dioxygenase-like cupin family protein